MATMGSKKTGGSLKRPGGLPKHAKGCGSKHSPKRG